MLICHDAQHVLLSVAVEDLWHGLEEVMHGALGACRGHQGLAARLGGGQELKKLRQNLPKQQHKCMC